MSNLGVIVNELNIDQIKAICQHPFNRIAYTSTESCWWTANPDDLEPVDLDGNPSPRLLGPRGEAVKTIALIKLVTAAYTNPEPFGKHELRTFWATYHGVIRYPLDDPRKRRGATLGRPWVSNELSAYSALLDASDAHIASLLPVHR